MRINCQNLCWLGFSRIPVEILPAPSPEGSLGVPRVSHLSDSQEEEALGTRLVLSYVTRHELAQQSQQSSNLNIRFCNEWQTPWLFRFLFNFIAIRIYSKAVLHFHGRLKNVSAFLSIKSIIS